MMDAPEVRYGASGEIQLVYQVVGEGPPDLVFVPGSINNTDQQWIFPPFQAFVMRLSGFARLILYDKRSQAREGAPQVVDPSGLAHAGGFYRRGPLTAAEVVEDDHPASTRREDQCGVEPGREIFQRRQSPGR
jgi:hypothetical protein